MTLLITDPSRKIDDLYGKFARIGTFFRNVSKTLSILTEISKFQEVLGPDMGKGRDGTAPRFFVPVPKSCPEIPGFVVPRDFNSGTVPQIFVPVPTVSWL